MAGRGVRVGITVQDDGFGRALTELLRRTANLQPVFDEVGSYLLSSTQERFEAEAGPDGTAWPALAASTLSRPGRGSPARKLRDRGHLYASLNYRATRLSAEAGTNRAYARIHQKGGKAGRGRQVTIPARPYLGISEGDRREIGAILHGYLSAGVTR